MSFIATTKFGNCHECGKQNTNVVKVGKHTFCLQCRNSQKNKVSMDKAAQRDKDRRALATDGTKVRKLGYDKEAGNKNDKLTLWFNCRRLEMQNVCVECGRQTNRDNAKFFKWSICHIVPKSLIKSVATNENNWIELCQLHHQEYDNSFDRAAAMMCFGEIKMKFQLFKHLIPVEELRKINPHLLDTL